MPLRERRQVETVKNLLCDCLILLANTDRHLVEDIAYGSIMKAPPQYLIFRHTEIFAAEGQFACRVDIEELGARILEDDADISITEPPVSDCQDKADGAGGCHYNVL